MVTINLVFSQWDRIFRDQMAIAAAIDRLIHHAVVIQVDVPSYRTDWSRRKSPPSPAPAAVPPVRCCPVPAAGRPGEPPGRPDCQAACRPRQPHGKRRASTGATVSRRDSAFSTPLRRRKRRPHGPQASPLLISIHNDRNRQEMVDPKRQSSRAQHPAPRPGVSLLSGGIMPLRRRFRNIRLEAATAHALTFGTCRFRTPNRRPRRPPGAPCRDKPHTDPRQYSRGQLLRPGPDRRGERILIERSFTERLEIPLGALLDFQTRLDVFIRSPEPSRPSHSAIAATLTPV